MSEHQRNRLILYLLISFLATLICNINAQQIQLEWKASENQNISHYNIYKKFYDEPDFTFLTSVNFTDTSYIVENIPSKSHLFYAITAVGGAGIESGFSNIVEIVLTGPTPVELSNFAGFAANGKNILEWTTATESNNYGFEIQRSKTKNSNFEKIGFVEGNGTTSKPSHYKFIESDPIAEKCYYRLKQVDFNGEYSYSEVIEIKINLPNEFEINQNYPNPFNSSTIISYKLPQYSFVEIKIFDINGRLVNSIIDEFQEAGNKLVNWNGVDSDGTNVPSGMYFYKITAMNVTKFGRMTLIK